MVNVVLPLLARLAGLNATVASEGAPGAVNESETGVTPVAQVRVPAKVPAAPGTTFRDAGVTARVTSNTVIGQSLVIVALAEDRLT